MVFIQQSQLKYHEMRAAEKTLFVRTYGSGFEGLWLSYAIPIVLSSPGESGNAIGFVIIPALIVQFRKIADMITQRCKLCFRKMEHSCCTYRERRERRKRKGWMKLARESPRLVISST